MDRLASALEQLSRPNTTHREVFRAPDFTGEGNVEDFIQQFEEVATANEWSKMATLLHIRTHLRDDARECGSHATLERSLRGTSRQVWADRPRSQNSFDKSQERSQALSD